SKLDQPRKEDPRQRRRDDRAFSTDRGHLRSKLSNPKEVELTWFKEFLKIFAGQELALGDVRTCLVAHLEVYELQNIETKAGTELLSPEQLFAPMLQISGQP
ncbi:hypothetical protein GOODEAATRI_033075, partial [Goodea atripinnis]